MSNRSNSLSVPHHHVSGSSPSGTDRDTDGNYSDVVGTKTVSGQYLHPSAMGDSIFAKPVWDKDGHYVGIHKKSKMQHRWYRFAHQETFNLCCCQLSIRGALYFTGFLHLAIFALGLFIYTTSKPTGATFKGTPQAATVTSPSKFMEVFVDSISFDDAPSNSKSKAPQAPAWPLVDGCMSLALGFLMIIGACCKSRKMMCLSYTVSFGILCMSIGGTIILLSKQENNFGNMVVALLQMFLVVMTFFQCLSYENFLRRVKKHPSLIGNESTEAAVYHHPNQATASDQV